MYVNMDRNAGVTRLVGLKGLARLRRLGDTCVIDPVTGGRVCTPPMVPTTPAPTPTPTPQPNYEETVICTTPMPVCLKWKKKKCVRWSQVSPQCTTRRRFPFPYPYLQPIQVVVQSAAANATIPPSPGPGYYWNGSSWVLAAAATAAVAPAAVETSAGTSFFDSVPTWAWIAGGGVVVMAFLFKK